MSDERCVTLFLQGDAVVASHWHSAHIIEISNSMDKNFKPIEDIFLRNATQEQPIPGIWNLERCQMIAESYALTEGAISVLGDSSHKRSFCYYGHMANRLGLSVEERLPIIPSLYEEFLFSRVHPDDLQQRHIHELAFLYFTRDMTPDERRNYYMEERMRVRDAEGRWFDMEHKCRYLAGNSAGAYLLILCVYRPAVECDEPDYNSAEIVNICSGKRKILTSEDYSKLLSPRELDVLQFINRGMLSKEIADRLCIAYNTVNRHRQNILAKLKVDNAIEACSLAKRMGLL